MRSSRYPQKDLFTADLIDTVPKSDIQSLEHPIYSLSKRPLPGNWIYRNGDLFVEVKPNADGMPSLFDKDVLTYAISQLREGMNREQNVSRRVEFHPFDLFKATNRPCDGKSYQWLKGAIQRLKGTTIETNIASGGKEQFDTFGIIDEGGYIRQSRDARKDSAYITLCDWTYRAVEHQEVLTLSRDYFRIKSTLQRRLYEIARKHCGNQRMFAIGMDKLYNKAGSRSSLKSFRYAAQKAISDHDAMPDYWASYNSSTDQITFYNKKKGGLEMVNNAIRKSGGLDSQRPRKRSRRTRRTATRPE